MSKAGNNNDKLFVPNSSDISLWTFHWTEGDRYYITADVNGSTQYLKISSGGLTLVSEPDDACKIQVVPGTGAHSGEICLKSGNATLTYSGNIENGFKTGGSAGTEWLRFVELSELTEDYFMPYSAVKVSVSDEEVTNGSRIIVYTRVWNDTAKKYEFYAVDHDGSLVRCYESGDDIEWVGSRLNSMLWNFVEYYWEGTTDPNFYYELFNQYSEKFIAPQVSDGQILSDSTIGLNMNGRRDGKYYTPIFAWDEDNYAYVGLKADVENGTIVSCPRSEADDFYFAVVQDIPVDDTLHLVDTVDNTQYGITMKIKDFGTRNEMSNFLGSNAGGAVNNTDPNLLSTALGENGYPTTKAGNDLSAWFGDAREVNHLFVESTFRASGYYEYDATQNFASLHGSDFVLYQEIGTVENNGVHYQHGQFFPFNDLTAGVYASANYKNLTNAGGSSLPESDPRKYEQLYLVKNQNYYLGMEIEASFTQTPDGLDDWGHDIIYEFTGDDDFWLYVDGELIIDLGGIHNALSGSVNYRTGDVMVNGTHTTLRALFESNFRGRNPDASEDEVKAYLARYFEEGSTIFKDYTSHTMKIFYLERGAGASNLHMRFNLVAIKTGTVELSKELGQVDEPDTVLAEFPYQIYYKKAGSDEEYLLTNALPDSPEQTDDFVVHKGTDTAVSYHEVFMIAGIPYRDVFLLKPGETAEISFPEDMTTYRIVECGVNTEVYESVAVNGTAIPGTRGAGYPSDRADFGIEEATADERARVVYRNNVNPEALRTLTIQKLLYDEHGVNEIGADTDNTAFSFRLYMGTEFEAEPDVAHMHTYHVKDPQGYYCKWDTSAQKFTKIGNGISDYSALTEEQKEAASFTTSINGAISRIPAGYTVVIRDVLAGTRFKVVERPGEIPDGYSFQKYLYYENESGGAQPQTLTAAKTGVSDTITAGEDPAVKVCNLKGWGLRVNKVWSDAEYMTDRKPTYFAVFTRSVSESETGAAETGGETGSGSESGTENGNGNVSESGSGPAVENLTLVTVPIEGSAERRTTLRQLPYGESSLYWYFLPLPVDVPFDRYEIREVKLTNPAVDADGYVTAYESMDVIPHEGELVIRGTQKSESAEADFTYTVLYDKGQVSQGSNVRVDTVTNNRPGIVLKKTDWSGNALAGAVFTLKDEAGDAIGTFTSDENGLITTAFLSDNQNYTLTETNAPKGYHGLEDPVTMCLNNGAVTVSSVEETYYILEQGDGKTPELTIKNKPFELKVIKQGVKNDGSAETLGGVHFELHREIKVDNVVSMELVPMTGYGDLVSAAGTGIVTGVDETLHDSRSSRSYYLIEKNAASGYLKMDEKIRFTITENGTVILDPSNAAELAEPVQDEESGKLTYTILVKNYEAAASIRIIKVDQMGMALEGAEFSISGKGITTQSRLVSGIPEASADSDDAGNPASPAASENPAAADSKVGSENPASSDSSAALENQKTAGSVDGSDTRTSSETTRAVQDAVIYVNESIPAGTYTLTETSAPAGYIGLEGPVTIMVKNENGTEMTVSASIGGKEFKYPEIARDKESGVWTITITNQTGYELPSTGGPGTGHFTVTGSLLIALAGGSLLRRRRRIS